MTVRSAEQTNFKPDSVLLGSENEGLIKHIKDLQDGEVLKVSHSFLIIRMGGKNIAIDPVLLGRSLSRTEPNKLIPPSAGLASQSQKTNTALEYNWNLIYTDKSSDTTETQGRSTKTAVAQIAEALAPYLDVILLSHLDADHYDFEFIRTVLEENKQTQVFGPLGWQGEIAKYHSLEVLGEKRTENFLPERIGDRLHALSGKPAQGNTDRGLRYPGLELDKTTVVGTGGSPILIKASDIPHLGGGPAEYVNGYEVRFLGESILIIPDAALSPEAIQHLVTLTADETKKIKTICVSTATLNPETFYGIFNEQQSEMIRKNIEEGVAHSAYLPLVVAAFVAESGAQIVLNHSGFYYRSSDEESVLRGRYPEYTGNMSTEDWLRALKNIVLKAYDQQKADILTLGAWTLPFGRKRNISLRKFIHDFKVRKNFASEIIDWIQKTGVPDGVLKHISMSQSLEVN